MRAERSVKRWGGPGASVRLPEAARISSPRTGDRPSLRLTLAKGGIGIELGAPLRVGPIEVVELAQSLPGVRFPVDLSGGVERFRHRRGVLMRLSIDLRPGDAVAWSIQALRGLLGDAPPEVVIAPIAAGALVGVRAGASALAFDVVVAPVEADLVFSPERARGVGLGAPAHVLAMHALAAILAPVGRIRGGSIVVERPASLLTRHMLPAAGARVPSASWLRWDEPSGSPEGFHATAAAGRPPPALGDRVLRALELADLAGQADELAFHGDLEAARARYLGLLERAPRHPEVSRRLAAIDAAAGERVEAALATLVDAGPAIEAGLLGGELLAALGDGDGARTAISRAAQDEPYGPLASLAWLRVAALSEAVDARLDALDRAVVRAPSLDVARWARFEARLDIADMRGARADAEHLEAAAFGSAARHEIWRRAAGAFLARGFLADASSLFERALRYMPASAEALAGLARSLMAAGQERRALDLLARAAAIAARSGKPLHAIEVDLARGLAEIAGDRPAAIARVRAVPPDDPVSLEARLLEGRWRAEIGDLAGASLALGRLRDGVELLPDVSADRAASIAALLVEAARIEELQRDDLLAAQRHMGLALRLRPRHRAIAADFRRLAAATGAPASRAADPAPPAPARRAMPPLAPMYDGPSMARSLSSLQPGSAPPDAAGSPSSQREPFLSDAPGSIEDETLVDRLSDRLRADPTDRVTAVALADALARLGRDLDLLALLSAQMDEGGDELRRELTPRRRETLARLATDARAKGRASEAELYEMMLASD